MQRITSFFKSRLGFAAMLLIAAVAAVACVPANAVAMTGIAKAATTATSNLDNLMKIIYSDPLITDIVNDSELMSLFKSDFNVQTEQTTGGKYVETAHYLRLAGAAGARSENDYIPVPQSPRAINSRIYLKKIMGVVEMTGDVMEKVVGDEGSFINFMERALPDTKERVVTEVDRMYIGFGAGIKARIAAKLADGVTVDRALGIDGYEDAWLQFQEGETVVAGPNPDGTALRNAGSTQAGLVENIDETSGDLALTIDAGTLAAWQVDDFLFSGDAAGVSTQNAGVDREIAGLLAAVDDGGILDTYQNVVRADNRTFNARVIDASVAPYNGALTEDLLIMCDAVTSIAAGAKIDALVMSPHAPISYWKDMKQDRTLNDTRSVQGGMSKSLGVLLGDRTIPFKTARKLPPQIAFGLTTKSFRRFTLGTWEWISRGGSIWNLVTDSVGRKDAYFAFGKMYEQLACLTPRRNFRIEGLVRQFDFS
jgi:hypothetical protein